MILILAPFKAILILTVILVFFIFGILNQLCFFYSEHIRKTLAQLNTQWACFFTLKLLNFRVDYQINKPFPKGALLICNHLSYTDVLIIASKFPTLFVTSIEMKKKPFLGWITQLGECLYVDRKSHKNINSEVEIIQTKIRQGFNVLVFPESTTSDGLKVKPFKSSLLKVADGSGNPLISYCLKFTKVNGADVGDLLVQKLAWHSDETFFTHFLRLITFKSIECELKEMERVIPKQYPDRKALTEHLFIKISAHYDQHP